jgi:uncharacterized Zn-finger protein
MELQRHLRRCVKTGWVLKVMVQRLSEEQILALTKPHSGGSQSHENHSENLKSAEFLQQHADSHSTQVPSKIKCAFDQCNLIFSSSADLKEHRKMHFQAIQCSCGICGKLFKKKYILQTHIRRHSQMRPYACDIPGCSYSGKVPNNLYMHKKEVHTYIFYTCLLCGKNIKSHHSFKLHMAKHKTDTPGVLACIYQSCKQMFQNVDELQKHAKVAHTNLKQL